MLRKKGILFVLVFLVLSLSGCKPEDKSLVITREKIEEKDESSVLTSWAEPGPDSGLNEEASTNGRELLCVHVCGAVCSPGVYYLPEGSRVYDALQAADGFTGDGATEFVNLALPIHDGEQIYFPTMEEAIALKHENKREDAVLIDINTADEDLLCTLPGIGETRAKDIIAYRKKNGRFEKPEDLMKVSGIKQSIFDRISDCITVN